MHPARNVTMTSAPSGSTDEGERGIVLLLDSNGLICADCWGWHMVHLKVGCRQDRGSHWNQDLLKNVKVSSFLLLQIHNMSK